MKTVTISGPALCRPGRDGEPFCLECHARFASMEHMALNTTNVSGLGRLIEHGDEGDWRAFDQLYRPHLVEYARRRGLDHGQAEDVAQECMISAFRFLKRFKHNGRKGALRRWLYRVAATAIRDKVIPVTPGLTAVQDRAACVAEQVSPLDRIAAEEHLQLCLEFVQLRLKPKTYEAFYRRAILRRPVTEVCTELGLNRNQVHLATSRGAKLMRQKSERIFGDKLD